MTRNDVLGAVSKAFGARTEAVDGFWNVRVLADPPREVVFTTDWVQMHVGSADSILTPDDLEKRLRELDDGDWHQDKKLGYQFCLIR